MVAVYVIVKLTEVFPVLFFSSLTNNEKLLHVI